MPDHAPTWINDGSHDRDIARFILEGDDFANRIVSRAAAELHRLTDQRCRSFAAAVESGDRAVFRATVEALYLHLKQDHHLRYEYERAFDEFTGEQQVRLPSTTREENRGTCIDLTVLFLSCLANAKLAPIYVQSQHHAMAAVWLKKPDRERSMDLTLVELRGLLAAGDVLALECTGFAEGAPWRQHKVCFDEAVAEARSFLDGLPPYEFRFALDVGRAWEDGLRPFDPTSPSPEWQARPRPYDFAAFLELKRQNFTGREWLFAEIDAWRRTGAERALLITGDPGIGKSAIVAELVHRNPGGQVLAYHCCQNDELDTLEPWKFVRSLAAMIAAKLPDYAARLSEAAVADALGGIDSADQDATKSQPKQLSPVGGFEKGILYPLKAVPPPSQSPCYLLVDALDEALAPSGGTSGLTLVQLLASRLDYFPPWLRLVATTRKERAVLDRLSGLRARELNAQEQHNLDDVARYVRQRLADPPLAERLAASGQPTERTADVLRTKADGNFLFAQQALDGLASGLYRVADLDTLPPGLNGLYDGFFRRHFPDDAGYAPVRRLLRVVVAAREPLPEDLLARAASFDAEDELPGLLRRLGPFLRSQPEPDGARRYTVYHKSFADWLTTDREGMYYASPKRGHERLAEVCWAKYRQKGRSVSGYALAHLPAHLAGAERGDDLAALLCDLPFLEAKAEAGHVFDLAGDFTRTVAALQGHPQRRTLQLLEEALRTDIHFLARHPGCLFQCLWNRCWWYDCAAAAGYYEESPDGQGRAPRPWEQVACGIFRAFAVSPFLTGKARKIADAIWEQPRLAPLLESWHKAKKAATPGFRWLRSLRPPSHHLDTGLLSVLRGHEGAVYGMHFSPDGRTLASASDDQTVRLWDAATGAELRCLRGHEGGLIGVSFSPDGRTLASAAWDNTVRLWDAQTGAFLEVIAGGSIPFAESAGGTGVPRRAIVRGLETVIEAAATGEPVAWFPITPDHLIPHPSGPTWAGSVANYLCLFTLQGADA